MVGIMVCLSLVLAYGLFFKLIIKIACLLGIGFYVMRQLIIHKNNIWHNLLPSTFLNKPIGIFLIAAFLSCLFGVSFNYSQQIFFSRYLMYIALFFLAVVVAKDSLTTKVIITIFLLGACVISLGGIFDWFILKPNRLHTSFGSGHLGLDLYYAMAMPMAIAVFLFGSNRGIKIIAAIAALLSFPCVAWNNYRSLMAGIAIVILFLAWFKRRPRLIYLALLVIAGFSLLAFAQLKYRHAFRGDDLLSGRTYVWKSAIDMWKTHPWFGVGLRNYPKLMLQYEAFPKAINRRLHNAHSAYLQILAEMGIIGLIAFLSIFAVFITYILRQRENICRLADSSVILGVIAGVICSLVGGLVEIYFIYLPGHSAIFWVLLGLGVGLLEKV